MPASGTHARQPAGDRPRLLLVTRNFPPLVGGMERLNLRMAEELALSHEVSVVAPREAVFHAPPGVRIVPVRSRPLGFFLLAAGTAALREARRGRPETVLAGSGLTAPIAWLAARLSGARAAAYVHGLDLAVRHPLYRALWLPCLRRLDVVVANSTATVGFARAVGIPPGRIALVPPGTDLPDPDPEARARFRARHGLPDRTPLLLSVGRLTRRKGLREFITESFPLIVAGVPDTVLVVVGSPPRGALHARAETPAALLEAARELGVEDHLRFTGDLFGADLDDAYAAADVHVFPVREDPHDPEGFGMVSIEAAARGVPTVAYATGGVRDAVSHGVSGRLVHPGDAQAFARAVLELLAHPPSPESARAFARNFAWPRFGERLRAALAPLPAPAPEGHPAVGVKAGAVTVTFHPDPEILLRQLHGLPSGVPRIVVENTPPGERSADLSVLLAGLPETVLVDPGENTGLAAGTDLGIRALRNRFPEATHVLVLDQDSEPRPGCLEALAEAYGDLERAGRLPGAVGPRLLDPETGEYHALHVMGRLRWRRIPPPPGESPPVPVSNLNGSGTFMPLDLYEKLGGLDRSLFIDHVDTEWSFRILASGHTLWCIPSAVLVHRMGRGSFRFWCFGPRLWPIRAPDRHRSLFRNTRRLLRRPGVPRVWKTWAVVKLLATAIVYAARGPERAAQLRAMRRGWREGR